MKKEKLYINPWDYYDQNYTFQLFVGGRGIGKSFGFTQGWIDRHDVFALYLRRTEKELRSIAASETEGNPFYDLVKKKGKKYDYIFEKEKDTEDTWNITSRESHEKKGIAMPLSTIGSVRGGSYSRITDIFHDEFIAEKHIRRIRDEGEAILNAYETVNRNREFDGSPPVRYWGFANAFDIYNPLFVTLDIVTACERMIARNQQDKYFPDRGLAIHLLEASDEFKKKKEQTAIMKLTKGTKYHDMALGNQFAYNNFSLIEYRNLKGYKPLVKINNSTIFYNNDNYYLSYAINKTVPAYNLENEQERMAFNREYNYELVEAFVNSKFYFESYALKSLILDVII